jgi:hypothetical protein
MAFVSLAGVPRSGFLADLVGGRVMAQQVLELIEQPAHGSAQRLSVGRMISRVDSSLPTVENASWWLSQAIKNAPAAGARDARRAQSAIASAHSRMKSALDRDADAAGVFGDLESHIDEFRDSLRRGVDLAMSAERAVGLTG